MIDDEIALELVDFWIANSETRSIPEHLKGKVSMEDLHRLQRPYREHGGKLPPESLKDLRNDILSRLNEKRRYEQYERWQKITNSIAALAFLIAFVALYNTYDSMNRQLQFMGNQTIAMNYQAGLMNRQTNISEKQANISQELLNLQKSRSPYLVLSIDDLNKTAPFNSTFYISKRIDNNGNAPAYNLKVDLSCECCYFESDALFVVPYEVGLDIVCLERKNKGIYAPSEGCRIGGYLYYDINKLSVDLGTLEIGDNRRLKFRISGLGINVTGSVCSTNTSEVRVKISASNSRPLEEIISINV